MKKIMIAVAVLCVGALWGVSASAYTVLYDPGTTQEIEEISRYATTGDLMAGMEVTVTYSDLTTNMAVWQKTGAESGGAYGSGWSLEVAGDTYVYAGIWELFVNASNPISSIYIAGLPGETFFDVKDVIEPHPDSTEGSGYGFEFDAYSAGYGSVNVTATYRNLVTLEGASPVGDLYADLEILFPSAYSGAYDFYADTDNTINAIPLPASAVLLLSGLIGIIGIARRKSA